jgi:hypothetical protein
MMAAERMLPRWFLPGDGINPVVISADIQQYLGNDATVRPGKSADSSVDGYWIKAYRNLTSVWNITADNAIGLHLTRNDRL